MQSNRPSVMTLACLFAAGPAVFAQDGDKGLDAVREFLQKAHGKKKWRFGPEQITSEAITQAYGGDQKFYYVFTASPLRPGANLPGPLKAYEDAWKDYRENFISATVRVDAAGKVVPLAKAEDYNEGLMAVKDAEGVKVAAAAVLSLFSSDHVGPGVVKAAEVKVTKTERGWQGVVDRREFQGTVEFNHKGEVSRLSKPYTGPLPPRAAEPRR